MQQQPVQLDPNDAITIKTTAGALQHALMMLGKQPYEQVAAIIQDWQQQAIRQAPGQDMLPASPGMANGSGEARPS
jgi:hypothetical protein